jgi:hypothetical protein
MLKKKKILIISMVILLPVFITAAILYPIYNAKTVIMTISYSGGLCADGICKSPTYYIYEDGTYTDHEKLSKPEINKLEQLIKQTNPNNYKPITPGPGNLCPSAYDGSDTTISFPQKSPKKFTTCEWDFPEKEEIMSIIANKRKS